MTRLLKAALLATVLLGASSEAGLARDHDHDHGERERGGWGGEGRRGWGADERGERRGWGGFAQPGYGVAPPAYRAEPPPGVRGPPPGRGWRRGQVLPPDYRSYVVPDYGRYRLRPPPPGYNWIGVGRDIYLMQDSSGLILDSVPGAYEAAPPAYRGRRR